MIAHSRNSRTAERLFLFLAALLVVLIGGLSYRSGVDFRRSAQVAAITQRLVEKTNALLSSLKDAETGQRGFLLTGEDRYLEPYHKALQEIAADMDALAQTAAQDRSDQAERIGRLKPLVQAKLRELASTIDLRQQHGFDAALAIVRTDQGKVLMDEIRTICDEVRAATYDFSGRESRKARTAANQTALTAVIGSAGIFALLVFATISVERATGQRLRLIDALRISEDAARKSRDWWQATLASIGDAVIATDSSGRVTLLNAVAERLTGWTNEDAAGKPLEQVFVIRHEETGAEVESPVRKVLREGRICGLANHTVLVAKDGRQFPIDDSAAPIRDSGGEISGVILVFRDISARRDAEKRLAGQAEELRRTARLMDRVACFVHDLEGRIIYWNPGAAALYGFSRNESLGRVGHTLLRTVFPAPVSEIHAQLHSKDMWDGELIRTCSDGRPITVASHWALHRDDQGRPAAILEGNIDITRLKETEEALRAANAALERANEGLNRFAFAASHDLQEPLRMINIYAQLLLKNCRGQLDGEAAAFVEIIGEGAARMNELVADLLAYAQVTGPRQEAAAPVDLNEVFQTALENCKSAIEETHAGVTSDPLPAAAGQESQFVQLFQNLISNGLKYRSERPPRIHVSAEIQDNRWRIAVQDNGMGIAAEHHDAIFGMFKRLHGPDIPGTGIGLAICQQIVERAGGRIWVESRVGQGAIFYFTLPFAEKRASHGSLS